MNYERNIPTDITDEGERLFFELFEISFKEAQELATWEGEIGDKYRGLFEYIKNYKEEHEEKQSI